ncbi:general secretion pathway protein GspB, partial [Hydrogenophaga sp.]
TPPPPAGATAAPSAPVASGAPASAPPVKVTGATYSDNPAHRMLIVNGKIVMEGQQIEPGLTLEVITPHSAVLNHQGSRFNINY